MGAQREKEVGQPEGVKNFQRLTCKLRMNAA